MIRFEHEKHTTLVNILIAIHILLLVFSIPMLWIQISHIFDPSNRGGIVLLALFLTLAPYSLMLVIAAGIGQLVAQIKDAQMAVVTRWFLRLTLIFGATPLIYIFLIFLF